MAHEVKLTHAALDQLDDIVSYIARDAPDRARQWRDRILNQIESLEHFPLRHGLAPEADVLGVPIHQMMFGSYRVLYAVTNQLVIVHGIRHGARRWLRSADLPIDLTRPD
jgi:plasmid stabilization system protein ParE